MKVKININNGMVAKITPALIALTAVIAPIIQSKTVTIIGAHQTGSFGDIIVNHLPWTDHGKISWWMHHRDEISEKYKIPHRDENGIYHVMIWSFGDGYKEEDDKDRLCFEDMTATQRCIEKNALLLISSSRNRGLVIESRGASYRIEADGSVTRLRNL